MGLAETVGHDGRAPAADAEHDRPNRRGFVRLGVRAVIGAGAAVLAAVASRAFGTGTCSTKVEGCDVGELPDCYELAEYEHYLCDGTCGPCEENQEEVCAEVTPIDCDTGDPGESYTMVAEVCDYILM
jgi:hypothetical protein